MLRLFVRACCLMIALAAFLLAAEPEEFYQAGLAKLREAQFEHSALVPAVKLLAHAASSFEAGGDAEKVAEVNACLYWARKKMTLADTEEVRKSADVQERLETAAKPAEASEAQKWLERAEEFAKGHAADLLLVAVRYFEVGDRFPETAEGRKAIQQSLAAMQKIGETAKLAVYKPAPTDGKALIKSEPPGAAIILWLANGGKMNTGQVTPSLVQLPLGPQTLELSLNGYKRVSSIISVDGKAIASPEAFRLDPLTVPVDVVFEDGWQIFVDGKKAKDANGKHRPTPCTIESPPGKHTVALAREGFLDISQQVDVEEGTAIAIKEKPKRGASLLLKNGPPVDLLPLINLSTDAVSGNWKLEGNALLSPADKGATLQLPYQPPEEYILNLLVERRQGASTLAIGLLTRAWPMHRTAGVSPAALARRRSIVVGRNQFVVDVDADSGAFCAVYLIDGLKAWDTTEAKSMGRTISDHKPHLLVVEVREKSFLVKCDERTVIDWKPNYSRLSNSWPVPSAKNLFLGAWKTVWRISRIQVVPVNGAGDGVKTRASR